MQSLDTTPAQCGKTRAGRSAEERPLVTCVVPTKNRKEFLLQSIRYFKRQDYPVREMIILDDGDEDLKAFLPDDPRICYLHLDLDLSIGKKRNLGCQLARGEIIAHWDDDDWYAPERLSAQVAPLLATKVHMTALSGLVLFDIQSWEFCSSPSDYGIAHATLVFRREVWEALARYPNQCYGENEGFSARAKDGGALVEAVPNDGLYLYVRHSTNCSFSPDQRCPRDWTRIEEPALPSPDRAFYREQARL